MEKSVTKEESEKNSNGNAAENSLPDKLLKVISNMYLDAPKRLCLKMPPRCANDLSFCHQNHFRSDLPEAPIHSQAIGLRSCFQQERYVTFVSITNKMCRRKVFPGTGMFTRLTELILVRIFLK